MSIGYGNEKRVKRYERPRPRYREIDEKRSLLPREPENLKLVLGMRRSSFLLCLYLVFYGAYLTTGGLVFAVLEGPGEEEVKQMLLRARMEFLKENACVKDETLEELIEKIIIASDRGVSAVGNVSGESNWSFGQSLFFSSTVVTTIGYGHVTPLSKEGKFFCIAYAIFGIPLTLTLLTALVERLMVPSRLFLGYLNSKLRHALQPFGIRLLHLFVVGSAFLVFFWFIPAAIFAYLEPDWDYMDSMYYCFISLTAIGLGDYIPGDSPDQQNRPLYKVFTTGYLLSGLTFLIFTLTVFYEIPQLNIGTIFLLRSDEKENDDFSDESKKFCFRETGNAIVDKSRESKPTEESRPFPAKSANIDSECAGKHLAAIVVP